MCTNALKFVEKIIWQIKYFLKINNYLIIVGKIIKTRKIVVKIIK